MLPELFGTSRLFDIQNGKPIAVINAGALTGMRTGADAVGAKYLARADVSSFLMVGTGMLAAYSIAAILLACPWIESVNLVDPLHPERAEEKLNKIKDQVDKLLAACGEERCVKYEAADNLANDARKAHIIVTGTPSKTPFIKREWVMPGTHISCMGADMAGKQELDSKILADASVFVDDISQSISVGECELAIKNNFIKKINNEVFVNLSDKERDIYDILKKDLVVSIRNKDIDAVNAATISNKLLQMAYSSVYEEDKNIIRIHDIKLDALEDLIEGANGKPVLIAYWYKSYLRRIKDKFDVRELKTNEDFKEWNQGKIPVAITHRESAGHGLNLQAGNDYYAVQKRVNEMIKY